MRPMLMMFSLILTACPVRMIEEPPCRACREECDDHGCDACRAENCPDMALSEKAHGGLSASGQRDRC